MQPFFKFKLGYIDGFKGNPIRCPNDKDYIFGYEAGADDDFMELGGDSLIAINVVSRLREVLGLRLQVAALFEAPTVAQLAKRVEALRWATAPTSPATENVEEGEL